MYTALRATSVTLANHLKECFEADPLLAPLFSSSQGGTMVITLNTPQEMEENNNVEGLSLWLYRVVRDDQRLNVPPEQLSPGQLRRLPLPIRGHYLVTPIVSSDSPESAETEHTILGKVLQVFHDRPILRGSLLQDDLAGSKAEVNVRLEPLGLEEITRVWEALDRSYQLSVSYEVSVVEIASGRQPDDVALVDVALPEYGVIVSSQAD